MYPRIFAVSVAATLLFLGPLTVPAPVRADDEGTKVYQEGLKSVVWIYSPRGKDKAATGTGSLVDRKLKLILTNYHVVGDGNTATVMFPAYKGNKVIAERD
jgi:S1-C subfamily serine protease